MMVMEKLEVRTLKENAARELAITWLKNMLTEKGDLTHVGNCHDVAVSTK